MADAPIRSRIKTAQIRAVDIAHYEVTASFAPIPTLHCMPIDESRTKLFYRHVIGFVYLRLIKRISQLHSVDAILTLI